MERMLAGRQVVLFPAEEAGPDTPLVILYANGERGEEIHAETRRLTEKPFHLAVAAVPDWDAALSPWPARRVFKGGEDFAGRADQTVRELETELLPGAREALACPSGPAFLAGYSLAGLFAVYALYRTGAFRGAVSASGSLWYPGFREFCRLHEPVTRPERVYFSLGDRESRTRNPVMAAVEDCTGKIEALFRERGVETVFELNPGNHFQEPERRLAKGLAWILKR